jgi:hypothetical protein
MSNFYAIQSEYVDHYRADGSYVKNSYYTVLAFPTVKAVAAYQAVRPARTQVVAINAREAMAAQKRGHRLVGMLWDGATSFKAMS